MTTLTNDQMVEIAGGWTWNPDALGEEVCLNCYRALLEAGVAIAEGSAATVVGAIIAALVIGSDVYLSCKPCVQAVIGE
ncbi:MAG: hypothetical protein IKW84_01190 [Bacteroidaceae bacterium]|nr:hypothetical protein [Bacteroidaceae bacterium]